MGNNSKFLDGVLWGMLIGGAAVFLLGTEKGKKILDILTEEGVSGLNKVIEQIENQVEDIEDETVPDEVSKDSNIGEDIISEKLKHAHEVPPKPKAKRFFRSSH